MGTLAGAFALAALVVGAGFGNVHAAGLDPKLIAWVSATVLLVAGIVATARLSLSLSHLIARGSAAPAAAALRVLTAVVGYLFVLFSVLTVLSVSIERLLVGAGLAGVVLGIAAQQSLGNVFAGIVLILARPFGVGDHIRIRSGPLGGIFDAWVVEMSLTYVTVRTADGPLKIPNSAMLSAGVGLLPSPPPTVEGTGQA
jgi:small-conductance mechanosensitive channel